MGGRTSLLVRVRGAVESGATQLDELPVVEVMVTGLVAAVVCLPALGIGPVWPAFAAAVFASAATVALRSEAMLHVRLVPLVGIPVFLAAAIHADTLPAAELAHVVVYPLIAVAVTLLVTRAEQRRRVLVAVVVLILAQLPVAAVQAARNVVDYGRDATPGVDGVTGLLGGSQASVLGLVALAATILVIGARLADALPQVPALLAATGLLLLCALTATRAAVPFVVAAAVALALAAWITSPRLVPLRRLAAVVLASGVAALGIYGVTEAIYPGAFVGVVSNQFAPVLGGNVAAVAPSLAPATGPDEHSVGDALLPGRLMQLRLAARLSVEGGPGVALLGRGPGASTLRPGHTWAGDVPLVERVGSTWIGIVLTDVGWLGVAAFALLLGWLVVVARAIGRAAPSGSADRALALALPAIAALTALGAVYLPIMVVRGYAMVFWILVGLAMSAARPASRQRSGAPPW